MMKMTQRALILLVPLLSLPSVARGQDIPAVTYSSPSEGFSLPVTPGTLTYGATGSESVRTGYSSIGPLYTSIISGDLGLLSTSLTQPFSLVYSGGYMHVNSGSGVPSSFFQNLALSQVLATHHWSFIFADSVRYLPDSPADGLSGIPGAGNLGTPSPVITDDPGQGILSNFATRVTNLSSGTAQRAITGKTSFESTGSYQIQRFVGQFSDGVDSNQLTASAGLTHHLSPLDFLSANYSYSQFSYPTSQFSFATQGINVGFTRQLNRAVSVHLSAGPQRTTASDSTSGSPPINLSIQAGADYTGERSTATLSYFRGVQSGSGLVQGALSDNAHLSYNRPFGRTSHASVSFSYSRNDSIAALTATPFSSTTISAGIEASRALSRYFSGYISYAALQQSLQGSITSSNGFSGISSVVSAGITYSPRPIHFGHQ
jgi:hypothetical protein